MSRAFAFAATAVTTGIIAATASYVLLNAPADDIFSQCQDDQGSGGDIGGPFTLINKDGQTITDKEILKDPALVYFGYTFCPDVCPMDMMRNAEVADILEAQGHNINLVFITVDPARDTPQIVGEYTQAMHPRAIGLTGTEAQISQAVKAYRGYYKIHDTGEEFYPVDHSSYSYLMLPEIGFAGFYRNGSPAEAVAKSAACRINAAKE